MISRFKAAFDAFRSPLTRSAQLWDAAAAGSRWASGSTPSSDFITIANPPILRSRARDSYRNNPWCRRVVNAVTVGAVGCGIKPQLRMKSPEAKEHFNLAWDQWGSRADFNGRLDFYGLQGAILRTVLVDGEVLVRIVPNPALAVPIQLQILSGEFLDSSRVDSRTLNGIEYDETGRRTAYWLYRKHPAVAPEMRSVRVPADQVLHIFDPIQPGAERGITWLAPALMPLKELREYLEAALVRAKVSSLLTGFITSPEGGNVLADEQGVPSLEPGSMVRLKPGESVEFTNPFDAGAAFDPFIRAQLRAISSALDVPYEIVSGDLSSVTFASGRHALIEYRRHLEYLQHHLLVHQALQPIWNTWTRLATGLGVISGEASQYSGVRWIPPALEMLDPQAETAAKVQKIRAGLLPRSEAVALDGWDIEAIDREYQIDNSRVDRMALVFDSDPRHVTQQGQEQQSNKPITGAK